jgi:DNA-binding NarL/FixJ family response regulator
VNKIKVVIADDQKLICEGIRIILEACPDIEVAATAENGHDAVRVVDELQPDVALLDIQMPGMSGLEALKTIKARHPKTAVLILTTFDPDAYIFEAFRSGADGYLLKDMSGEKLAAAIRDAHSGNVTIPASIAARIIAQIPRKAKSLGDYGLTQREQEIAGLIVKGYSNDSIVSALGITLGTVKNYVSTLYQA